MFARLFERLLLWQGNEDIQMTQALEIDMDVVTFLS